MFNPTAPVNEQLALYSDLFMLIAALVYAAAFILFTIDMATASVTIRRLEADLAAQRGQVRTAPARETVGVAVGGSTAVGASDSDTARPAAAEPGVDADDDLVDEDMD
ncbi:c-type cytochrome biogenesis protein CcsB, partial [Micrococcus luteus]|nr:c-type cytochrome biogenesis protein CcsB [Micrococcus luteus]